jgi:hypothetical protein
MSVDGPRRRQAPRLGDCPLCAATIPPARLLAEYRHPDEWPRLLAECPGCDEVVAPK